MPVRLPGTGQRPAHGSLQVTRRLRRVCKARPLPPVLVRIHAGPKQLVSSLRAAVSRHARMDIQRRGKELCGGANGGMHSLNYRGVCNTQLLVQFGFGQVPGPAAPPVQQGGHFVLKSASPQLLKEARLVCFGPVKPFPQVGQPLASDRANPFTIAAMHMRETWPPFPTGSRDHPHKRAGGASRRHHIKLRMHRVSANVNVGHGVRVGQLPAESGRCQEALFGEQFLSAAFIGLWAGWSFSRSPPRLICRQQLGGIGGVGQEEFPGFHSGLPLHPDQACSFCFIPWISVPLATAVRISGGPGPASAAEAPLAAGGHLDCLIPQLLIQPQVLVPDQSWRPLHQILFLCSLALPGSSFPCEGGGRALS